MSLHLPIKLLITLIFMRKILFVTNNQHKLIEIKTILNGIMEVLKLSDIHFYEEIPETGQTLKENASQKSHAIFDQFQIDCFSDDTGLEIDALNGRPGVYSARYAGEGCSFHDNVVKVLKEMENETNRLARFRTVISLILNKKEYFFDGVVEGEITRFEMGNSGFGYDPIFRPLGFNKTFGEIPDDEKNAISHRGKEVQKLASFLSERI